MNVTVADVVHLKLKSCRLTNTHTKLRTTQPQAHCNMSNERCWWAGCTSWAFNGKLCRPHAKENPEVAQSLRVDWEAYAKAPAQVPNLFIFGAPEHPVHLQAPIGTQVDVVAMCADQRTAVVRTAEGKVGYYGYYSLATEQQIYEHHLAEEARKVQEKEEQERAAEAAKLAAIEDRLAQNAAARDAHIQAQRHQELTAKQRAEQEQQRLKEAYLQQKQQQREQVLSEAERRRAEEERLNKDKLVLGIGEKRWEQANAEAERAYAEKVPEHIRKQQEAKFRAHEEEVRKREEELRSLMPAWKRELLEARK
eukprot:m.158228 g.158228  ORF g.158228 m.158228 type:complete len:309 (+) comp17596_c0_seq2:1183-2109(+)